jgi:hypothetical protein
MNGTDIAREAGDALDLGVDVPGGEAKATVTTAAEPSAAGDTWHRAGNGAETRRSP